MNNAKPSRYPPENPADREFRVYPDMVGRFARRGAAMVADNATVVGDVTLSEDVGVWFGVTIRGDDAPITIGPQTNVQDNTCVHVDVGAPLVVGRGVTIGHQVMLHGCTIKDGCSIGIQSVILNNAVIGEKCLVGAGALVTEGKEFPPHSLIIGAPAKLARKLTDEQANGLARNANSYKARSQSFKTDLVRID